MSQTEVRIDLPQAAVLPVGIPMGRQVDGGFGVRRGGRFCVLDRAAYALWCAAQEGLPRAELVARLSKAAGHPDGDVDRDVADLCEGRLLVELTGDPQADGQRVSALRPLPRAIAQGHDAETGAFVLLAPEGGCALRLDPLAYTLWSFWDGTRAVADSVREASAATGFSPRLARSRAGDLLRAAVRTGLVFLDIPAGEEA